MTFGTHMIEKHTPGTLSNDAELSRLINAAVVSMEFCNLLLSNPASALAEGYNGESFRLTGKDHALVLSIKATSLHEFALQVAESRNGKSHHR
jgi:hypothetical protein